MKGGRTRPVRVAHVTLQLDVGGMEKLLVEFARHTDRARFQMLFVSLGTRGRLAADIEACGWPVEALNKPAGFRGGVVLRLAGLFRRWQADIVHTHNDAPLIYGAPAARMCGAAGVVQTRHGERPQPGGRQTALVRLAASLTDRVVCVSEDNKRLCARQGLSRSRLARLWNGIDVARLSYVGPRRGGPAVLVARLSPEKDVATLLRAAAIVGRVEPSFRLEVAGDGPCFADLRGLTAELGLGEHVRFLGEVRDVPALLARAGLFVLPSLSEGISLTLLEAMARGLPVVATRVGGNPEVVRDGQTGFLVPPASPAALAEKVLQLLRDFDLGRRMGVAGRRRIEDYFNVRTMVSGYERLYQQLFGEAGVR